MSENLPYYYKIRGRVIGPKELSEMRQIAQRAQINSRSLISRDGIDFRSGSEFPEIFRKVQTSATGIQDITKDVFGYGGGNSEKSTTTVSGEWFYTINGQQQPNPTTISNIEGMIRSGTITSSDMVVRDGWTDWKRVSETAEFGSIKAPSTENNKPSNYLVPAILSLLCCCLPFGIVSVVYATQVDSKWNSGDHAGAQQAAGSAKMWFWIAFGLGMATNSVWIIWVAINFAIGVLQV